MVLTTADKKAKNVALLNLNPDLNSVNIAAIMFSMKIVKNHPTDQFTVMLGTSCDAAGGLFLFS